LENQPPVFSNVWKIAWPAQLRALTAAAAAAVPLLSSNWFYVSSDRPGAWPGGMGGFHAGRGNECLNTLVNISKLYLN
jgi:hypothetical protein